MLNMFLKQKLKNRNVQDLPNQFRKKIWQKNY